MKLFLYLFFLGVFSSCNQSKHTTTQVNKDGYECVYDSTFEYHFHILDSLSNSNPSDSIYACCSPTIKFMEDKTGIESLTDGTFIGKIKFTKFDLFRWHRWHENYIKK